tara:strand:- start:370 stop:1011 length:642 start_codon:yes stop_codon:yes gene_type:complete
MNKYKNKKKRKIAIQKRTLLKQKKKKKHIEKQNAKYYKTTLKYKISLLPKELQKYIYIWTFRIYWRNYIPLTAQIPSWQTRQNHIQKQLWNARYNNIHFLHLPFNTLPENKTWIMGCQCEFCIKNESINPIEKHCHYLIQNRNSAYFPDKFMPESTSGTWNENLSFSNSNSINHMNYHTGTLIKTFDPLYGSYKENKITKKLRQAKQYKSGYL